jgi:hypothetical protein
MRHREVPALIGAVIEAIAIRRFGGDPEIGFQRRLDPSLTVKRHTFRIANSKSLI